ncbi:MAG: hypothetical protein M3R02_21410 [Chloroflexota bacterium]|nr:hypothetical protein [Chloroflexota bacterium]
MSQKDRLAKLEGRMGLGGEPPLHIVFPETLAEQEALQSDDPDVRAALARYVPEPIDPRGQIILFTERSDGPQ